MKNTEAIEILKKSNAMLKQQMEKLACAQDTVAADGQSFYDVMTNCKAEYEAVELAITALENAGKIRVETPDGTLIAEDKDDPDYPGINIMLIGSRTNDKFTGSGKETLAMVEYDSEKGKLQAVVYGDGEEAEYTDLVEYRNVQNKDVPG